MALNYEYVKCFLWVSWLISTVDESMTQFILHAIYIEWQTDFQRFNQLFAVRHPPIGGIKITQHILTTSYALLLEVSIMSFQSNLLSEYAYHSICTFVGQTLTQAAATMYKRVDHGQRTLWLL